MMITLDQAIEIHAKVLLFRAGKFAGQRAKDSAAYFKTKGDLEGHDVWMKVATAIDQLKKQPKR